MEKSLGLTTMLLQLNETFQEYKIGVFAVNSLVFLVIVPHSRLNTAALWVKYVALN